MVVGSTIISGRAHPSPKFAEASDATGYRIRCLERRGKYLLFALTNSVDDKGGYSERQLVVHLGMTGALYVNDSLPDDPYQRASWTLADGRHLWFRDVRRFGRIAVVPANDYRSLPTLHRLGPEPFDPALDAAVFHSSLTKSRRRIKTQLLSQRPIAGIGNIYADEALWRARIHPGTRRVGLERADRLLEHLREVLSESLQHGGTTLRDYRKPDGDTGRNQKRLDCYGRGGLPCRRCGSQLVVQIFDQRTTTRCVICQRR